MRHISIADQSIQIYCFKCINMHNIQKYHVPVGMVLRDGTGREVGFYTYYSQGVCNLWILLPQGSEEDGTLISFKAETDFLSFG